MTIEQNIKLSPQTPTESTLKWVRRQMVENNVRPLKHQHGTMTGLRGHAYDEHVLSWNYFRSPDGGYYADELANIYEALGIVQGNGEWYVSAYQYDDSVSVNDSDRWNEFVSAVLSHVDASDFWIWDEND